MTGWTWAALEIRNMATRPSEENFGGVWVHRSTSALTSARASSNRLFFRIESGPSAASSADQADSTSYLGVRRGALSSEIAVLIFALVCCLNVTFMSGNGGSHLKVLPRSPWVPIAHSHCVSAAMIGDSSAQMMYVSSEEVATGG